MRINCEDTALLVVDPQERLLPVIQEAEVLLENSRRLIEGCRVLEVPIVVLRQYPKGLGDLDLAIKAALGEYETYDKLHFSACGDENAMAAIRATGCRNVLVCGIETHICVLQTVIDLVAEGFSPLLVCDCVSSRRAFDSKIGQKRAAQEGALLTTYEAALFELLGKAEGERFKAISRLVKKAYVV